MWPDRVSNPGPLTYESGTLPTALRGPAPRNVVSCMSADCHRTEIQLTLLHSERPKLHRVLAFLSAIGLNKTTSHKVYAAAANTGKVILISHLC